MDDVLVNKAESLERCIARIHEEYDPDSFNTQYGQQDSVILNITRACQITIDMGLHIVKQKKLGLPKKNREIFTILEKEGVIDATLSTKLQKMIGFRNIAVHEYQQLDLGIVKSIINNELDALIGFSKKSLQL